MEFIPFFETLSLKKYEECSIKLRFLILRVFEPAVSGYDDRRTDRQNYGESSGVLRLFGRKKWKWFRNNYLQFKSCNSEFPNIIWKWQSWESEKIQSILFVQIMDSSLIFRYGKSNSSTSKESDSSTQFSTQELALRRCQYFYLAINKLHKCVLNLPSLHNDHNPDRGPYVNTPARCENEIIL